jgi:hypothetical protein
MTMMDRRTFLQSMAAAEISAILTGAAGLPASHPHGYCWRIPMADRFGGHAQ